MSFAFAFDCKVSIDTLQAQLLALTPWDWRISESDTYGDSVWTMPGDTASLYVTLAEGRWVLEVHAGGADQGELAEDVLQAEFLTRVLPSLGARNVRPTETIR